MTDRMVRDSRSRATRIMNDVQDAALKIPLFNGNRALAPPPKPDCEVILGFSQIGTSIGMLCSSSYSSLCGKPMFMHWYVDFKIKGRGLIRCEALQKDGWLIPAQSESYAFRPAEEKIALGIHKLDPDDIKNALKITGLGGKYHVVNNNCQTWVLSFLAALKIPCPPEARTVAEGIGKVFKKKKAAEAFKKIVQDMKVAFAGRGSNQEANAGPNNANIGINIDAEEATLEERDLDHQRVNKYLLPREKEKSA